MHRSVATSDHSDSTPSAQLLRLPAMLFPDAYVWMIFLASMDVILTALVLTFAGGDGFDPSREINPIARLVIEYWSMAGAMLFKFGLVVLTIIICEIVGRHAFVTGRRLAWASVLISAFPVVWSLAILFSHRFTLFTN